MRIAVLSRNRHLYSTSRLVTAAQEQGHAPRVLDTLRIAASMGLLGRRARSTPGRYHHLDAIVPRIGASITPIGVAVVQMFEQMGMTTTATALAIAQSRNKWRSMQLMLKAKLPVPETIRIVQAGELVPAIELVGGLPVVIKPPFGTHGQGVILATTFNEAKAAVRGLGYTQRSLLVQKFIGEAEGRDLRIIVVGGHWVAAMERVAQADDFRANLHLGGQAAPIIPDQETIDLALRAARLHELDVAGVDLLLSTQGPLLLEVNSSPGLEGIEQATQVDVAGAIIRFLSQKRFSRR